MTAASNTTWAVIAGGTVVVAGLLAVVIFKRDPVELPQMLTSPTTSQPGATPPKPQAAEAAKPQTNAKPETDTKPQTEAKATPDVPAAGDLGPKADQDKPKAEPQAGHGEPPHFDVVRVEPSGDAVLAGKGDPNAKITLTDKGKVVAETKADPSGHFVVLPPALPPGSHDLSVTQSQDGRTAQPSQQNVAVSVPTQSNGQVVVALAEPGKPTRVLSAPPPAPAAPPASKAPDVAAATPDAAAPPAAAQTAPSAAVEPPSPGLSIRSVELENGNGFYATGVAAAGTRVELYLNGSHLAEVAAGNDRQWSVTIKKGLTGGHYTVRADALDGDRKVVARAEVPFDVPNTLAEAPKPAAQPAASAPDETQVAAADAPAPPSAPNPSEVEGVGRQDSVDPMPRPDVAAAAKKAAAAPGTAPPTLTAPPAAPVAPSTPPKPITAQKPADAPAALAETTAPAAAKPAAVPSANAVIEEVETATVVRGDNLWNISRSRLGFGHRYTQIYAANSAQIRDPRLIYPGQVFVVPSK